MSKVCQNCRRINCIVEGGRTVGGTTWFVCLSCHNEMRKEDILPVTLFHRITASPEVLAPKFVYYTVNRDQFGTYYWYCSALIPGEKWSEESEAIVATVAKLKEVCHG